MDKQNKELLLKDICARLPYGLQCQGFYVEDANYDVPCPHKNKIVGCAEGVEHIGYDDGERYIMIEGYPCELGDVKPFLRPMSSMTEEERETYNNMTYVEGMRYILSEMCSNVINFLNAHHIDYYGLISIGLALPAPDGMYK